MSTRSASLVLVAASGALSAQGCEQPGARRAASLAPQPSACAQATTLHGPAATTTAGGDDRSAWAVRETSAAIAAGPQLFGVAPAEAPKVSARIATVDEDNTPFLHGQIERRPIWRVTIEDLRLHLKSGEVAQRSLTYDILLDPRNGKVLKIISRWPSGVPEMRPEPRAASGEEQFANTSELYQGFPDEPPRVSLLDALDMIAGQGWGDPLIAKQIVAQYVVQSEMGRVPRAVWAVNLRGIPPMGPHGPAKPESAYDHMRHIVDAKTGRWLGAGTSPQPERPAGPETKEERRFRIALDKVRRAQEEKRRMEPKR